VEENDSSLENILSLSETKGYRVFPIDLILSNLSSQKEGLDAFASVAFALAGYTFDEIDIGGQGREKLGRLFAQAWLIGRANYRAMLRYCLPLSLLLDQPYVFLFDQPRVLSDLFSRPADTINFPRPITHSFRYDERLELFPELINLRRLPAPTRFTFASLVMESDYLTGFVSRKSRLDFDVLLDDLQLLETEGLVTREPEAKELLRSLDTEDLRRFAERQRLQAPKRRDDLIDELRMKAPLAEIEAFIQTHSDLESPVLPKISNWRVLRKFMYAEAGRFDLYLEWLALRLCQIPTVTRPFFAKDALPGDMFLDQRHAEVDYLRDQYSRGPDVAGVRGADNFPWDGVWDSRCEELIDDVSFEDAVTKVAKYLYSIDAVEGLKKALGKDLWRYGLRAFIAIKLTDKHHPTARAMVCPGCGHRFREYSVSWYFVQCVRGNVQFCQFCYERIIQFEYRANNSKMAQQNSSAMLDKLQKLSEALERIPTLEFLKSVPLRLPSRPTEKQIAVGRALLDMPSQGLYVERFGSWMRSLELAGVLEGGYRKTSRGIQVFASDGHLCLSLAEKAVDDWLSKHGVIHEKEPKYPFHAELNPNQQLRADWKVGSIYVEYAGLMDDFEYARRMERKKTLADILDLDVIILNERTLDELDHELGERLRA
jgi:hypothetical protein